MENYNHDFQYENFAIFLSFILKENYRSDQDQPFKKTCHLF